MGVTERPVEVSMEMVLPSMGFGCVVLFQVLGRAGKAQCCAFFCKAFCSWEISWTWRNGSIFPPQYIPDGKFHFMCFRLNNLFMYFLKSCICGSSLKSLQLGRNALLLPFNRANGMLYFIGKADSLFVGFVVIQGGKTPALCNSP